MARPYGGCLLRPRGPCARPATSPSLELPEEKTKHQILPLSFFRLMKVAGAKGGGFGGRRLFSGGAWGVTLGGWNRFLFVLGIARVRRRFAFPTAFGRCAISPLTASRRSATISITTTKAPDGFPNRPNPASFPSNSSPTNCPRLKTRAGGWKIGSIESAAMRRFWKRMGWQIFPRGAGIKFTTETQRHRDSFLFCVSVSPW